MAAELADVARSVIDANNYMALGTADEAGNPWVSPVWFASEDYRNFHWVSSPDAKHSRNLAAHPEVGSRSSTRRSRSAARRPCT
jgi:nitroimidazol reductase NimA-like FMN-containing flavoprotein (pyridoxamine 5'-phosphate oxidase superfamily)